MQPVRQEATGSIVRRIVDTARTRATSIMGTVLTAAKIGTFRMFAKHTFVSTMHIADTIMVLLHELLIAVDCFMKPSRSCIILSSYN